MKTMIGAIIAAWLALPLAGTCAEWVESGEQKATLVALFTSEGCSSCPPADKRLSELSASTANGSPLIPLSFHVDYWNYIGWNDPFSQAKFTDRQRAVAKANRQRTIYTPEFTINGQEARGKAFLQLLNASATAEAQLAARLKPAEGALQLSVKVSELSPNTLKHAQLAVAVVENRLSNQITAGENNGRTLEHDHVVRHLEVRPVPSNSADNQPFEFELAIDPSWKRNDLSIAVWLEHRDTLALLQALSLPVSPAS